ncbi:MAG: HAMP domain-containing sensor histidine kinase, partial [Thermoguttaceae bacterium]
EQQFDNRQRRMDLQQRAGQGAVELDERNKAFFQAQNTVAGNWSINNDFNLDPSLPPTDISGVLMTPLWIDGQLILARRVAVRGSEYVQGCVLNWPEIKTTLLESIEDLLPAAQLVPVLDDSRPDHSRQLAALPLKLVPGKLPITTAGTISPIRFSLAIVWVCFLLAAAVVAVLLAGVVRLSERRASFVTAVTHELRTPLTTFQIYTEMLAEDMVSDEDQRRGYLNTLRLEAVRLTHMVENVLSYARLEGGRSDGRLETVSLRDLIERIQPRLSERAAGAGMQFVVEEDGVVEETLVHTNVSAAEQVLFNLVDNACKYAAGADDKRIHLAASSKNGTTQLTVRDHGPGISPAQRKLLFQAFSKTAHEAARTAPGIGLGLALSRRLSRDMGGDLQLDETAGEGASFVFTLKE